MLDRLHALGGKAALALILGSTLAIAACGGGSSSTTGGTNPTATPKTGLKACTANLTAANAGNATATQVSGVSGKIAVDGSTALAPLFTSAASEFDHANGTQTTVTPNGSGTGLKDVEAGAVNIGLSDVFALEKATSAGQYSDLADHQVAVVPFTLVTNNDLKNTVDNLTSAQIQGIYTGTYTNWSQLGGPSEAITVVNRPASSGTRATFKKYVLNNQTEIAGNTLTQDTSGAVETAVAATPGSIGYLAESYVVGQGAGQTAPICIDGYDAESTNINSGKYQFWSIEHAYTKGPAAGAPKALIQYVLSSDFQTKDVLTDGYFQISSVPASVISGHTPSGAPAPESLS
jgi:phosphate transport system substrate-binding protein